MIRAEEVVNTIDATIEFHSQEDVACMHDYHKGAIDALTTLRDYILAIDQTDNWYLEELVEWGQKVLDYANENEED